MHVLSIWLTKTHTHKEIDNEIHAYRIHTHTKPKARVNIHLLCRSSFVKGFFRFISSVCHNFLNRFTRCVVSVFCAQNTNTQSMPKEKLNVKIEMIKRKINIELRINFELFFIFWFAISTYSVIFWWFHFSLSSKLNQAAWNWIDVQCLWDFSVAMVVETAHLIVRLGSVYPNDSLSF